MKYNWTSILGKYVEKEDSIIFKGEIIDYDNSQKGPAVANLICDQYLSNGEIYADIEFKEIKQPTGCEIIIYYEPLSRTFVSVGLGGGGAMYSIRGYSNKWINYASSGDFNNLRPNQIYKLKVVVKGSIVNLYVDNIKVLKTVIPIPLSRSQVGIWCLGAKDIIISKYRVIKGEIRVFVVMQFTSPYNELYEEVIKEVCDKKFHLDVHRADETYGPGFILADIIKDINESSLVIAEITSRNPNVFYEVGYAHALGKPTILIAEKGADLPFDISPFRTLLYENTIPGKKKIEEGLIKHVEAVLMSYD